MREGVDVAAMLEGVEADVGEVRLAERRAGVAARDERGAPGVERVAPQEVDGDDGRRRGEGRREEVGDEAMAYSVPI